MTPEPTSVMDELDAEIAYMDAINATASANQLRSILTRVAALVEAAEKFDWLRNPSVETFWEDTPDEYVGTMDVPMSELRALHAALLPFKGEK